MKSSLMAEFKKFLTIRSTYVLTAFAILFIVLYGFLTGYKTDSSPFNPHGFDSHAFIAATFGSAGLFALFSSIAAILLMAHEYRYNLIIYSLTASNSRSKVLISKMLVVLAYSAIATIPLSLLGLLAFRYGVSFQHVPLPHQTFNIAYILGRCVYFVVAYSLAALLFATLIRNLVGAIAVLFLIPGTLEGLLSLLLKNNNQYLPFISLKEVITDPGQVPRGVHMINTTHPLRSGMTFLIYLVIGWLIGWYLFTRRDAS